MIFGIKRLIGVFIFLSVLFNCSTALSQTIKILTSGEKTSIRGLSVVSDKIIWVSGSNGMIARSTDGGNSWKWLQVKGFEKTDFRDIEAFNTTTAVIMGIAEPAYILKTIDAGETWKVVYENHTKGMFLDAMDFHDAKNGIVIGDPIEKFFLLPEHLIAVIHGVRFPNKKIQLLIAEKRALQVAALIYEAFQRMRYVLLAADLDLDYL